MSSPSDAGSLPRLSTRARAAYLLVVVAATAMAAASTWMSDDAFISFRYAEHFIEGRGLVFNLGERVEGMTNLAWTVWVALGMKLGLAAETWSAAWGLAAYATGCLLLFAWGRGEFAEGRATPATAGFALLIGAAHPDWQVYATSGLETSAFTTTVLGMHLAIARGFSGRRAPRGGLAGGLAAVAALLRPDGLSFALGGAVVLAAAGTLALSERRRALLRFVLVFVVIWGSATFARVSYYGDFFPNTYYAKSADLAWWSQGFLFVGLYAQRYWMLLVFVVLTPALYLRRAPTLRDPSTAHAVSAACYCIGYGLYVARIGGGFMFARFLIPITPFLAICVAMGLQRIPRPVLRHVALAVLIAGMWLTPSPVATRWKHGVADERAFWTQPGRAEALDAEGDVLGALVADQGLVLAHTGGRARVIHRSKVPYSIDAEGGLTDPEVARLPLAQRGRPGHEKRASLEHLQSRGVLFVVGHNADALFGISRALPTSPIVSGPLTLWPLRWDPEVMATLRSRGAQFEDFDAALDRTVARLPELPREVVEQLYPGLRAYYFDHVDDPREAAFKAKLRTPGPSEGSAP